ncbi:phage terminase small subunit P27 family [Oceanidesulfovibrio indonesiensis]|uniref:Phage terminase small subunit P27 family n=1 Tax=Oceanidesulfovibrio indonesiensis TaxID=54767 RepID=A0A7M3MDK5_9BACT|nr:phage terminase small subunit P27 family [Oceanidesulfovibrio indonesiensis]TVM16689.1 phage terminase small subunit P27 family [Oceanidesulfovibrio indonesiensis]
MPKVVDMPKNPQACKPLKKGPRHLKGEARRKWNQLMDVLHPSVCTERQFDAVTQYCESWATYRQAVEALAHEPAVVINEKTGAQQPSAWMKIKLECHKTLFSLGMKLGLVPNGKDIPKTGDTPRAAKFDGLVR